MIVIGIFWSCDNDNEATRWQVSFSRLFASKPNLQLRGRDWKSMPPFIIHAPRVKNPFCFDRFMVSYNPYNRTFFQRNSRFFISTTIRFSNRGTEALPCSTLWASSAAIHIMYFPIYILRLIPFPRTTTVKVPIREYLPSNVSSSSITSLNHFTHRLYPHASRFSH